MATQTKTKKQVIEAIGQLGGRVTVADVASKTGLPILRVSSELNQIASDTQGHLEVSTTGDIAYNFPGNINSAYMTRGMMLKFEQASKALMSAGYFLLRISFGLGLILSLLIVIGLLMILIIYMSRGGDNRGGDRGFGFRIGFFDYLIIRDLLFYLFYGNYGSRYPATYRYDRPTVRTAEKGNFLFNCFSFLFGDGDPNQNAEERQWAMAAEVIRRSGGVVTAEQLAPYTGADPRDEDGVLPVLVRFNGKPEVTEKGGIVYAFPELQVTAQAPRITDLPPFLNEWLYKFSNVPADQMVPVYVVAGLNFIGAWILVMSPMMGTGFMPLILFLAFYGTMFLLVPLLRYLLIGVKNKKIEERNRQRTAHATLLEDPPAEVLDKLAAAKTLKIDQKVLTSDDAVYRSDRDLLEQEFDASP
ncbi:MAG: hypothetical protein KC777_11875 [Cyanobacteria bacterium HKST-UBA02]|nr:hypothetical protein [Cyanobacteria bacterium HKST-UBA02]